MLLRRVGNLPRWGWPNPFEELERMKRELFQGLARSLGSEPAAGVFPLMNVTEDKDNYYVRAELPGLKADDLDISVTGDTLSISGERKLPVEDENAQYHRREREAGRFSRVVTLPAQVATDKVQARFTDGVLTVTLPVAESVKPKQIAVKVA